MLSLLEPETPIFSVPSCRASALYSAPVERFLTTSPTKVLGMLVRKTQELADQLREQLTSHGQHAIA